MKQTFLFLILVFSYLAPAFAQGPENDAIKQASTERSSRQGVYLAGFGFVGSEVLHAKRYSFSEGIRLGGGITEKFILYVEANGSLVDQQAALKNLLFFDGQIKGQFYLWKDLYLNLGGGVTIGRQQTAVVLLSKSKTGFGGSGGAGYEFRVGKKFFIAPEASFRYRRLGGLSYLTPEIGGQLGWHF